MKKWTKKFNEQANKEGWNVFAISGLPKWDGTLRIQRIDDPTSLETWKEGDSVEPRFKNDSSAIRFVRKLAKEGKPHAIRALEMHGSKY